MSRFSKRTLKDSVTGSLFLGLMLMSGAPNALALPTGGTVVGGSATISSSAKEMDVTQSTNRAIINWGRFDIGSDEAVRFAQPSSTSVTLNRVTGSQNASQILGSLSANGTLMIVNAQGVVFGAGAQVNVGGLVASTADIDNNNFMKGNYVFDKSGNSNATISNEGAIKIADGGLAAFVGPNVTNTGLIQAKLGKVQLASGDTFTLDLYGDGLISLQASDKISSQLVSNSGKIEADGGSILMTAAAAENTINSVINMDGLLQADSVGEKAGHVVLYAEGSNAVADNVAANKGVKTGASTALVSGEISAKGTNAGEKGGAVEVLADQVGILSGAKIDASGMSGGGSIKVGGDFHGAGTTPTAKTTIIQSGASLLANALDSGNGGDIAVWADGTTVFAGMIEAKGGANGGNGGFVETSGEVLEATGNVDAGALAIDGIAGAWLLDPNNITISTGSNSNVTGSPNFTTTNPSAVVSVASILSSLNSGTNVSVTTTSTCSGLKCVTTALQAGNIEVANSIVTSGSGGTLTLNAINNITLDSGVSISTSGGKLNVYLNADSDSSGSGSVRLNSGSSISTNGGYATLKGDDIEMSSGSSVATGTGAVTFTAAGDITLTGGSISGATVSLVGNDHINMNGGSISGTTSVAMTSNNYSLTVGPSGSNNAQINGGAITLTSNGADVTLSSATLNGSSITLTAADNLNINGGSVFSNGGDITATGNGGTTISGATIDARGASSGGDISINGTGDANTLLTAAVYGASISGSTIQTNKDGTISIAGHGGNYQISVSTTNNYGVLLSGTTVQSENGSIGISGTGGSNSFIIFSLNNYGIGLSNGTTVKSTNGAVTLTGVGGTNSSTASNSANAGIYAFGSASAIGSSSERGAIGLTANTLDLGSNLAIQTTDTATFKPYTASTTVGVAGASGTLQVTSAILNNVTAGTVVIGSASDTGAMIANAYTWGNNAQLLNGTGSIEIDGAQTMASHQFVANAASGNILIGSGGKVTSSASGDAIVLAASNGTFTNNRGSDALSVTGGGRWLVYLKNSSTTSNKFNGLNSDNTAIWGTSYPTSVSLTGNRYVFVQGQTLTITTTNDSKTYGSVANVSNDYTVSGLSSGVSGVFLGDTAQTALSGVVLTLSSNGAAATADVGSYAINALSNVGVSSSGYGLTIVNNGKLAVNPASLTISANDQEYTYGNAHMLNGSAYLVTGLQNGETISVALATTADNGSNYSTSGNWKVGAYDITGSILSGSSAFKTTNYTIDYKKGTLTIDQRALTISANASDKTYDGNTNASVVLSDDRISGDKFADQYVAANFDNKNAGNGKTVTVTGLSINGADAANYTVVNPGNLATTTANIDKASLTISAVSDSKVYDGTTVSTGAPTSNIIAGDTITGLSQSYTSKNVLGTNGSTLVVNGGYTVNDGNGGNNYTVHLASALGTITPADLTITANNQSMTYGDGNAFTQGVSTNGLISGESIGSLSMATDATTSTSGNWIAGNWKITPSSVQDNGSFLASNYGISYVQGTLSIAQRQLVISANASDKTYDGNTNASVVLSDDRISGDKFADQYVAANFDNKNAGNHKTVRVLGLSIAGADAANYSIVNPDKLTTTTANIDKASLTISAVSDSKVYDGTTVSTGAPTSDILTAAGDTITGLSQSYASKNVLGTNGSTLVVNGGYTVNDGNGGNNYTVHLATALGTITPATLNVVADDKTMVYGTALPALTYGYSGFVTGDDSSLFTGGLATAPASSVVGHYPITQGTLSVNNNYNIAFTDGTLTVAAPTSDILSSSEQGIVHPALTRGLGYNGVLLAMLPGGLGNLAPASGGNYGNMSPEQLANLAPSAGGIGSFGGIVPLIECNNETPCSLNQ
jgi:filamentous hemagglutinin family protein